MELPHRDRTIRPRHLETWSRLGYGMSDGAGIRQGVKDLTDLFMNARLSGNPQE